jgi:hypothetical protein
MRAISRLNRMQSQRRKRLRWDEKIVIFGQQERSKFFESESKSQIEGERKRKI